MAVTNNYRERIRGFLSQHIRDNSFRDEDDLFSKGYLNSLFAMEMVLFVEKEFGLTVENADLDPDNFRSVSALTAFVERKTGCGGPA